LLRAFNLRLISKKVDELKNIFKEAFRKNHLMRMLLVLTRNTTNFTYKMIVIILDTVLYRIDYKGIENASHI